MLALTDGGRAERCRPLLRVASSNQIQPRPFSFFPRYRYGGAKLERARDLFEQCLAKVPAADAAEFYIKVSEQGLPACLLACLLA